MDRKAHLSVSKLRFNASDGAGQNATRSSSFRDKVIAKVAKPLRSRSKNNLNNSVSFTRDSSKTELEILALRASSQASSVSLALTTNTTALLWPRISISSQFEALEQKLSEELWITVEVSGEVKLSEMPSNSLDIVAILDCSSHSSPSCLEKACRLLVQLSHQLTSDDRLAIIATSQRHASSGISPTAGCILQSLCVPNPTAIEKNLRRVLRNRAEDSTQDIDLGDNLVAAFRILGYPIDSIKDTFQWPTSVDLRRAMRRGVSSTAGAASPLVIILSPKHSEFRTSVADASPVPVCVMQPSILPWQFEPETTPGWKLCASGMRCSPSILEREMRNLLDHARTATNLADITDIDVRVKPTNEFVIKEVVGSRKHKFLRPGEVMSLAICIAVPALQNAKSSEKDSNEVVTPSVKNERVILDLESFLGIALQDVLSIEVAFTCSMPSGQSSALMERESWALRRYDCLSEWLDPSSGDRSRDQILSNTAVMRTVMVLAVKSVDIQEAQNALERIYKRIPQHPELDAWKGELEVEIKYQTDLIRRQLLQNSFHLRTVSDWALEIQHSSCSGPHFLDRDMARGKENKMSSSNAQTTSGGSDDSTSSDATTIHYELDEIQEHNEKPEEDEARKIWKILRRDSKSKKQAHRETGVVLKGSRASDQTFEILRHRAIQSKRSIGADTLRSLSFDVDAANRGHKSPWL